METVSPTVSFPELEKEVLSFWEGESIFQRSLEQRKDAPPFMFYDGPPFATGTPHYGHLLAGTIKDIIPRYQTMLGRYVERRFGWDTHGLPIEMLTESELGLNGQKEIIEYGVDRFNEACRAGVLKYVKEWEATTKRLGRWIDFVNDYKTMDRDFMDSVWWVFKQLWESGRVYEGARVVPYSWRLSTPLSNFEASSNYKDVQDPAITVRFRVKGDSNTSLLAWTTTPWTLPSNLGLCVNPEVDYVTIEHGGEHFILAEAMLESCFPDLDQESIREKKKGSELKGIQYEPLFPFFEAERENGAFRVLLDDYVTTEDGTGIVHQSPAHGEDDFRVGQENGLPLIDPTDDEGRFTDAVPEFAGQNIKEADKAIIQALKEKGLLFRQETIQHSYPFCERSDTPLMYKAISAWYVRVEDLRGQMLENNSRIHWVPEHIREGRFGKWLEQARDWNVSRNRYWGNPIPIWRCDSCGELECLGSYRELEEKAGREVPDLHKHFVDPITWICASCGGTMQRVPEVLDCWFESGSMPYAQLHYPFENQEQFEKSFPADFIAEGLDQTRGWFYTLMVLSTALFGKQPFENVVVNGMILAEDGKKMSKRLKNYPDPNDVIAEYGADALRLFLIDSPVVRGESLRFSEKGVKEIVRAVLLPYWNVYSFFTTYASIDEYSPSDDITASKNPLDRWIISRLQTLFAGIEQEMGSYHLYAVVPRLLEFIEELTNWYVRRSRRRFWSEDKADKQAGYDTLLYVLTEFSKTLAPFLPFLSEAVYRNLKTLFSGDLPESIHLCDYPKQDESRTDLELEHGMELISETVGLGRTLRARHDIKTRQPLQSITVVTRDPKAAEILKSYGHHIKEELNVKEVLYSDDEKSLVDITVKPNFPKLGPIFGKEMKQCAAELSSLSEDGLRSLEEGGEIEVLGRKISREDIQIQRTGKGGVEVETAHGVTVFFDTELTPELAQEGLAREIVNRIQRMRKDADFQISDRIETTFEAGPKLTSAVERFAEYIKSETLSLSLGKLQGNSSAEHSDEHEIDDEKIRIQISRKR